MWRLSDELLKGFEKMLEESYEATKRVAEELNCRWEELPDAEPCDAFGVDGSRGVEKFSGVVFYAISSVAVGSDVLEMHEVTTLRPYRHIDDRIRLHMQTSEFRIGSMAEAEMVLMDGTLSGAVIRPPAYISDDIRDNLGRLRLMYDLDEMIDDFVFALDTWYGEIAADVAQGRARGNYLLTRTEYFDKMERGYRRGESFKEDLTILFEYLEYLHALNRLLEKHVIFVAKSFYTSEFSKNAAISDAAVLDYLAVKQFGEERAAYLPFKYEMKKALPFAKYFPNVSRADIHAAFVRFADFGSIYLLESPRKIDRKVLAKLKSLEVDGYLLPLIHAHRYAEIKKRELRNMMITLLNATDPKFSFLLKGGRGVLER